MPKITPICYKKLIKIFELDGFVVTRRQGDHIVMSKLGIGRPLVIKAAGKEVPITHIRTNMATAKMTRERYFELLERVK